MSVTATIVPYKMINPVIQVDIIIKNDDALDASVRKYAQASTHHAEVHQMFQSLECLDIPSSHS